MANSSDGSIRIDTELDNSGFEKGSDKLLSALKDLENSVNAIGDTLSDGLNAVIKSLNALSSNATTAYQDVTEGAQAATAANQQVQQSALAANQATQQMAGGSVRKISTEYNGINRAASSLLDQLQRLSTTAQMGFKNEGQVLRFKDSLGVVERKVEELRGRLNALGNTQIPTEGYKFLESEVEKTDKKLQSLLDRQQRMDDIGARKSSVAYKRLQYDIDNCREALRSMRAEMAEAESNGEAFIGGQTTAEYQNLSAVLNNVEAQLVAVRAAGDGAAGAVQNAGAQNPLVSVLAMAAQRAASAFQNMGRTILQTGVRAFQTAVRGLAAALKNVSNNVRGAVKGLLSFNKAAKAGQVPVDALVRSLTSFKTMLVSRIKRTFMSQIFKDLQEGVQQFVLYSDAFNRSMSNIMNTGSQISANVAVFAANLINLVEPVLTRLLSLINSLITAVNAVFALLTGKKTVAVAAQQASSYAASLNDAAGSASKAAKEQKEFNAELYGWDELTRQNKQNEDAGSGSGGGGGASGPSWTDIPIDNILPDWVRGWFDKLKDLIKKQDWEGIGELIADAINAGLKKLDDWINNTFRPWAVEWASRLARILNGVVKKLDWELLGKTFSDGLAAIFDAGATFLETFDFAELGRGIARALNAIFENKDMWHQLARFFAALFNSMIDLAYGFISEALPHMFNWGYTVSNALSEMLAGIHWMTLAWDIVNAIKGICLFIEGWLSETSNWNSFVTQFTNAFSYVVNNVDMARLGKDLSDLMMRILNFLAGLDWEGFGRQIGLFLANIDWPGVLEKVAQILLSAFKGFVEGLFSTSNGRAFAAFMVGLKLLPAAFALTAGLLKLAALKWVMTGVSPVAGLGASIAATAPKLVAGIKSLGAAYAAAFSEFTIGGTTLLSGAAAAFANAALLIGDAILLAYDAKALTDAHATYKEALETHNKETENALSNYALLYEQKGKEVADEWAKMCYDIDTTGMSMDEAQRALAAKVDSYWDDVPQNMWGGFKQGWNYYFGANGAGLLALLSDAFTGAINGIKSLLGISSPSTVFAEIGGFMVQGLLQGIQNAWKSITSFFSGALAALATTLSTAWNGMKTAASTAWNGIKTVISTAWTNIKTKVSTTVSGIKTTVSTGWSNLKSLTSSAYSNIKTTISTKFTQAKSAISSAVNNMKTTTKTGWSNMVSSAKTQFTNIYNTCKTKMDSVTNHLKGIQWGSIGTNLVNGLLNGLKSAWNSVTSWASSAASALTSKLKSAFDINSPSRVWMQIGAYLDEGLVAGLEGSENEMYSSVSSIAKNITDKASGIDGSVEITNEADIYRLEAILARLNQVANVIQGIRQALISMQGLRIPQIASGTVVPYKTRVSSGVYGGGYTDTSGVSREAVSLMRNILAVLQQSNTNSNQNRDVRVIIDGREVFNAVVRENERAIMRTGGVSPLRV